MRLVPKKSTVLADKVIADPDKSILGERKAIVVVGRIATLVPSSVILESPIVVELVNLATT